MDLKYYLVKAQEADALADAALSPFATQTWEKIAQEYRRAASMMAKQLEAKASRTDQ